MASIKTEQESPVPVHGDLLLKNRTQGSESILRINSGEKPSVSPANVAF